MQASVSLSPSQLGDFLLNVAPVRPVFIWGPPGIGKSALVQQFAEPGRAADASRCSAASSRPRT